MEAAQGQFDSRLLSSDVSRRPRVYALERRITSDAALASLVIFLLPIQTLHAFSRSFDVGVMLSIVLIPLLLPALLKSRPATRLVLLLLSSACGAALLAEFSSNGDRAINRTYEFGLIGRLSLVSRRRLCLGKRTPLDPSDCCALCRRSAR